MSLHERAHCHDCPWTFDGPGADRAGHLHTTSKAKGHEQHATVAATHPSAQCGPDCAQPPRTGWFAGNYESQSHTTRKEPAMSVPDLPLLQSDGDTTGPLPDLPETAYGEDSVEIEPPDEVLNPQD